MITDTYIGKRASLAFASYSQYSKDYLLWLARKRKLTFRKNDTKTRIIWGLIQQDQDTAVATNLLVLMKDLLK